MGKIIWIFFFAFCLIVAQAKEKKEKVAANDDDSDEGETEQAEEQQESGDAAEEEGESQEDNEEAAESDTKEFVCNLKYKRIGCYADKGKKDKPLSSFMESDAEIGGMEKRGKLPKGEKYTNFNKELPKFACKCANDAITNGNAIFGLQNFAECWSGPDDSKYDKDGPSEDCVTFDYAKCEADSEICAGKKHANFMYYVDTPEHTKTQDEINAELAEEQKKAEEAKKKAEKNKKGKKKKGKKSKKH